MLSVLGYIVFGMNQTPVTEVATDIEAPEETLTTPTPTPVVEKQLPEYPITKVDTTGWEYRETKLGNVGIRYKTIPLKQDFSTNLNPYGVAGNISLWSNRSAEDVKLGRDIIFTTECGGPCGGTPSNFIKVQTLNKKEVTMSSLSDLFTKESCDYEIVDGGPEVDGMSYRYNANPKCDDKPNYNITDLPPLCVTGSEVKLSKNPFITSSSQKTSDLITCKVVNNAKSVDDSTDSPKLNLVDRELFLVDLGNSNLAIVTHQLASYPEYNSLTKQQINNLMHTILSTIEVL